MRKKSGNKNLTPPKHLELRKQTTKITYNSKNKDGYKIISADRSLHGAKVQLVMDVTFKKGRIISMQRGYSHLYRVNDANKKMMLRDAFYSALALAPFSPSSYTIRGMHYLNYIRK